MGNPLENFFARKNAKDNSEQINQQMQPLIQKANARNAQKLKSGQITRDQYRNQSDIIFGNNQPKVHTFKDSSPIRDLLDSNSSLDQVKRTLNRQPILYRDQQIAKGDKRPFENLGGQIVGNTARFINTGIYAGKSIGDTISGDVYRQRRTREGWGKSSSGLFGVGTIYDNPEEMTSLGSAEIAKRVGLNTVGVASEIAPFKINPAKGASLGRRILTNGAVDAVTGAGESAARQYVNTGDIDIKTLAGDVVSSTALGVVPSTLFKGAPTPKPELPPAIRAKRDALINGFTTAQDRGRTDLAQGLAKQIEQIDNPPVGSLRERIRTAMKLSGDQRGFVGDGSLLPEAPQVGKTDPLEALKAEARKYKSAEEFVNSQTPFYRGATASEWLDLQNGGKSANKKTGRAFVGTRDDAEMALEAHLRSGKKGNIIIEYKPTAKNKLVSGGNLGENTGGNLPGEYQAKDLGLSDIARVYDENGKLIYDDTKQLTDLYNQATAPQVGKADPNFVRDNNGKWKMDNGSKQVEPPSTKPVSGKIERSSNEGKDLAEFLSESHKTLPKDTEVTIKYQPAGTQTVIPVQGKVKSSYGGKVSNDVQTMSYGGKSETYNSYRADGRTLVIDTFGNTHVINNMDIQSVDITPVAQVGKTDSGDFKKGEKVGFAGILSPQGKERTGTFVRQVDKHLAEIDYGDHTELNHVNNLYKLDDTAPQLGKTDLDESRIFAMRDRPLDPRDLADMERTAPPVMQAPLKQLELKDATTPFSNEQENLVKEYASYLKSIDDSATGGQMLKTNDGYTRYSEHSPFYREYYAQYKRKPSKQAWEDHAREELIQGRADPTMQKPFNDLSDPEYRSLVQSQEKANSKGTVGDKFLTDPLEGKKIKVKGPMTDENYQARYGKTKEPTKVKVKPFTADDYAFEGWKDKSTLGLGRETLERNIDRVAGKDAPRIKKFLVDSSRQNETGRSKFLTSKRTEVNDYVVKKLGIKPKSNESALVQKFGEGLVDLKTLKQSTANWRNVVEGSKYFRREYDNLLDQWNSVRRKYGYQEVPKRKDYFRHFNEIQEGIAQLGIIKNAKDLPTNISGLTDIFKPSKPFSNAELRRYTNETTFDAVSGFDNYLDSVSRQIYHTDTVQKGRFLENKIRKASEQNPEIMLPNFVANLGEWTNLVSGKKARIDRAAEALVGRKVYAATDALRRQTSANMVGANLASALSNFIPFTQSISTTKKIPFAQGLFDTMFSPFKGSLREIDGVESSFLTRRFTKDAISKTGLKKAADVASTPFKLVDEFTSRSIVAGKYYEGLSDGLSPKMAMKAADDYASRVITDRSIGQTPNILNSKTAGFLTQFQTEVNNQVSFLIRDIPQFKNGNKLKIASALTQFVAFSYLFNEAYEGVIGRRPQIDPINAGLQLAGQGENSDKDLKERIKGASDDVLGGLPLSSLFTGGRLPVSSTLPDVGALTKGVSQIGSENDDARRNIYKGISGPLFYGLPPFGGGQLKKTLEAGNTISKGYSETPSGQIRFAADRDPLNIAKGLAFGQYSTDAGKEYIKNGIKPYGETDSELFKKTEDRDVLRSADTERKVNKEKEAVKSENNGNTLSNGKYYAKVGDEYKTFDSENDYKKAQVKAGKQKKIDDFVSSEEKTREIDGVMYLKSDNEKGYTTKTKAEWNFDKQTVGVDVGMDKAKASKDLKTWSELAKKKYNALVEKRKSYDPETEFDKIDLIDKQLLNIEQEYAKYASYGGFTKGKKQRSKGSGIDSTAFKVNNLTIDTYKKLDSLLSGTRRTASVAPPKITTRKPELKQIRVRA